MTNSNGGSFKAKPKWRYVSCRGCLQHQRAHKIISDQMHVKFLVHHVGRFASQDVHIHGYLDIAQEQFRPPPLKVKLGKGFFGKQPGIKQGGYDGRVTGDSHP